MYRWLKRHIPSRWALLLTAMAYALLLVLTVFKWAGANGAFRYLQL